MSFFSSREASCSGARLHCIQRDQAILHAAPWVEMREWDNDLMGVHTEEEPDESTSWKEIVLDGDFIDKVEVLWTQSSGTGKTRHIQECLRAIRNFNDSAQTGCVVLHEGSTLSSLTCDLTAKFPLGSGRCAVHFSFQYMPDLGEDSGWLESINHFFFSFLVLRSVQDPVSCRTFYLGRRQWKIFVELPSGNSILGPDWLHRCVPSLSFFGSFRDPPCSFRVNAAVRRVCTYLRALENGTINRKFCTRTKEVVFVLDKSGSMQQELSPGRSALSVATDNALSIFDTHLHVGDVSALSGVLFWLRKVNLRLFSFYSAVRSCSLRSCGYGPCRRADDCV